MRLPKAKLPEWRHSVTSRTSRQAALFISFNTRKMGTGASRSRSLHAAKQASMNPSYSLPHCSDESSSPWMASSQERNTCSTTWLT